MLFAVGGAAWRGGWRERSAAAGVRRSGWRARRLGRVSVSVLRSARRLCKQQRALYKGYQ